MPSDKAANARYQDFQQVAAFSEGLFSWLKCPLAIG